MSTQPEIISSAAANEAIGALTLLEFTASFERVKAFTSELFPGGFEIVQREDCEVAGDHYFVFHVRDSGELSEILSRNSRWHGMIGELSPVVRPLFRLSIDNRR